MKCKSVIILEEEVDKQTQDLIDAGNDILKSVSSAIDRNDYSTLAADISRTLKTVSIEKRTTYASRNYSQVRRNNYTYVNRAPQVKRVNYPFLQKRVSRYSGLGQLIAGATVGLTVVFPTFAAMIAANLIPGIAISGAFLVACTFISCRGIRKLQMSKKLYQYGNILKEAEYFKISDLAKVTLKTDEEVLKDIKALIKEGYVPRAKLDSSETTCMITDNAYQMYLGAEQDRLAREQKEQNKQKAEVTRSKNLSKDQAIIAEGEEYVKFVREINDIIPDTDEMSDKLYRLENIMNRIFAQVEKDPDSAEELHKLMNYYLPTTKKLLMAYVELDKQPDVGENITKTKKEIDAAMDTINEAFENLLDSLFQDMAWDISSDISVMKSMMAQDGLTTEGQGVAAQMQMKQ